ncbi:MAG: hypothetical protein H6559_33055 [Lewinellaceae bacterium]|nr:hypothetical protein [Lewinellaceae bacterium]
MPHEEVPPAPRRHPARLFAVLVGAVAVIAYLFEDKVGRQITKELNKQLKSELVIRDFELTVIRTFPNVAKLT